METPRLVIFFASSSDERNIGKLRNLQNRSRASSWFDISVFEIPLLRRPFKARASYFQLNTDRKQNHLSSEPIPKRVRYSSSFLFESFQRETGSLISKILQLLARSFSQSCKTSDVFEACGRSFAKVRNSARESIIVTFEISSLSNNLKARQLRHRTCRTKLMKSTVLCCKRNVETNTLQVYTIFLVSQFLLSSSV